MIANCAFLAAMVVILAAFWLLGQLGFLAPYKHVILGRYLGVLVSAAVVVFLNLFATFYMLSRQLFLKDTGQKLAHVDRQLHSSEGVLQDLSERLRREE